MHTETHTYFSIFLFTGKAIYLYNCFLTQQNPLHSIHCMTLDLLPFESQHVCPWLSSLTSSVWQNCQSVNNTASSALRLWTPTMIYFFRTVAARIIRNGETPWEEWCDGGTERGRSEIQPSHSVSCRRVLVTGVPLTVTAPEWRDQRKSAEE